jgi:hypothetical protein
LGLLVVALGLLSILGGGAAANAQPTGGPAARHRHRHRARPGAAHLVAHRRAMKRSSLRGIRYAAPPQPETNESPEIAFVTLTTAAKGTSFYVDSRRVGTGSTVRQQLPPGYHQFQAVHPSGARWQKYLSFEAGDDRELIIHW